MARVMKKEAKNKALKPKKKFPVKAVGFSITGLAILGVAVGLLVYFLTRPKEVEVKDLFPNAQQMLYDDYQRLTDSESDKEDFPHTVYIIVYQSDSRISEECQDEQFISLAKSLFNSNAESPVKDVTVYAYNLGINGNQNILGNANIGFIKIVGDDDPIISTGLVDTIDKIAETIRTHFKK